MRPLIGITTYSSVTTLADIKMGTAMIPNVYVAAVRRAGGCPVLLPAGGDDGELAEVVTAVDGLVLPCGPDINPHVYGQPAHIRTQTPDYVRDGWEHAIAVQARARNVPLLGICRGMQVMNVAFAGTLHQHLRKYLTHMPGGPGFSTHKVNIQPGSKLGGIMAGTPVAGVHTRHHQAVDVLGYGLSPVAWAEDGTVEAVESDQPGQFLLGVQWHPERDEDQRVFGALVGAAAAPHD